jgi:mono/diheme cytochrome c family protein
VKIQRLVHNQVDFTAGSFEMLEVCRSSTLPGLILFLFVTLICSSSSWQQHSFAAESVDEIGSTEAGVPQHVQRYLQQHCYRCHGETKQKAERRLDIFTTGQQLNDDATELLEEALDALNRGEMPPRKEGVDRPSEKETKAVIHWITSYLERKANEQKAPSTVLRRLNRFEYVRTMRDLLGIDVRSFDPTGDFPPDAKLHGFDNNGEALTLSDYQLQRYIEVAESYLDQAICFDRTRPETRDWSYTGKDFNGVMSYQRAPVTWRLIVNSGSESDQIGEGDFIEIGHGQPSERHPNFVKAFVKQGGVPADGWYNIRIRAAAANRQDHGYEHAEFERYRNTPLKIALWIAPEARLLEKTAADQRRLAKVWDLPDGNPEWFTERVWLYKGAIPFLSWANGVSSKGNIRRVALKYHPEVIRATNTELDAAKLGDIAAQDLVERLANNGHSPLLSEVYHGPRIRIWAMDISGPIHEQWPPASHQLLFGEQTDAAKVNLEDLVVRFAARAFRQPVQTAEVEHYVSFMRDRIKSGDATAKAIKLGLAAILTSPRFLYLDEGDEQKNVKLEPHELATRLSYFLWSSMPDEKLTSAASVGGLSGKQLTNEAERLLTDSKSDAFIEHFTDHWLRIDTLGAMPPDPKTFETYYKDRLETFFKQETRLFFADLLQENGSLVNLLNSDYSFLNGVLAKHYGVEGVVGERFRKVAFGPQHHRGGLLGQGSVLTLTANGIETSPVVRGVWVLENLLGTPPSPPPPDVEPLEPDTRGAVTVREQLKKHRNVAACADCHSRIDPAGFALEFYDPIGGYRSQYMARNGRGPPVDGSGKLVSGETFRDEQEFKQLLIARKDRFTEVLTAKLLAYATGRELSYRDDVEVKRIASECVKKGYGLRDLVLGVIRSEVFQKR